jgi:hypothetical protein
MAGSPSTAATFKLAKQASKGTAATTGFITGMMTRSSFLPALDIITKTAEHGVGYSRATAHKTATRRGSYLGRGSYRGYLYPDLFGLLLLGNGFSVTTTGASANKTHTFKLAARDANPWLTALWNADGNNELRGTDVRGTRLVIDGTPDGVTVEGDIVGLTVGEAAGTETTTAEDTAGEMLPTEGTLTLVYDPAGTPVTVLETPTDSLAQVQLTINNPVDENDRSIHRFARANINQTGVDVLARLGGMEIDWDIYNRILNGSTAGTSPSTDTAVFSLTYSFESAANITGTAVPYSVTVTIPRIEFTLDDFAADGDSLITWNAAGRMIDNVTDPITIALVSKKASY